MRPKERTRPDVPLRLVYDRRKTPGLERRRGDCQDLAACEWEWVRYNGCKQAKCPEACPHYKKKEMPAPG